jgi:hypothetical protein
MWHFFNLLEKILLTTLPRGARRITYHWIKSQVEQEAASGQDMSKYASSMVVGTLKPTDLGSLRQQDGAENFAETQAKK